MQGFPGEERVVGVGAEGIVWIHVVVEIVSRDAIRALLSAINALVSASPVSRAGFLPAGMVRVCAAFPAFGGLVDSLLVERSLAAISRTSSWRLASV